MAPTRCWQKLIICDPAEQKRCAVTYSRFSPIRQVFAPRITNRAGSLIWWNLIERLAKSQWMCIVRSSRPADTQDGCTSLTKILAGTSG